MVNTKFQDATYRQQLDQLLRKQEASVRRAFMMSIRDIQSKVTLRELRDALQAGDVDRAIRALHLERGAYTAFSETVRNTYTQAGAVAMAGQVWRFPDMSKAVVRWDMDNPRARRWIEEWSSRKITGELIPQQVQAVRTAIEAGYSAGRGPRDIALDIVGRMGANGRRTGGIVGLNEPQARYVQNMREYLQNDPRRALSMTKRDKRFDRTILKAINEGKPLKKAQIDKMTNRYSDRLLKARGDAIARTETAQSVNAAKSEAMKQGLDETGIPDSAIVKVWKHAGPAATKERTGHEMMHNEEVRGVDTPFVLPDGTSAQYPLDPALPARHTINCRCSVFHRIRYDLLAT